MLILQPVPLPFPKEWVDKYLDSYLASRGDYGWAGWLLMTAILVAVFLFLWGVVRNGFKKLADDVQEIFKTLSGLVREATAAMVAVKVTQDAAALERKSLIDKVDALIAAIGRMELVNTYQGKQLEELKDEIHRAADATIETAMACGRAQGFVVPPKSFATPDKPASDKDDK